MMTSSLHVYRMDMKYIRDLQKIDSGVMSVSPQIGKEERPFLGVIVMCNGYKYCVPLSKPKEKHKRMRNKIDFKKIEVDGELLGVLNFNLMVPVKDAQIKKIDTIIRKHDNYETKVRKAYLAKELNWCNEYASDIRNTANVLYQKYISGDSFSARAQCLDFPKLENACEKYNKVHARRL
ncbi:MAG: type III toxin-antitoxin system ToxN/AbiQ family toxin [Lachnospiraceae bacterium]|nr:type III toxin-antitoxin system ToxN/AbiQ family toxin [Lachnospiraceae bacterium]